MIEKGNSETGIPLGILGLTPFDFSPIDWLWMMILSPFGIFNLKNLDVLVVEMGVDDPKPPKNMGYLLTILKPDISIFLNVWPVHTMQFEMIQISADKGEKSPQINTDERSDSLLRKVAEEKGKIITQSGCKVAVYNRDNRHVRQVAEKFKKKNKEIKFLSFGEGKTSDLSYRKYTIERDKTTFEFYYRGNSRLNSKITIRLKNYLLPEVYQEGLAAAILAGLAFGIPIQSIKKGLESDFVIPKGRASFFEGVKGSTIIDSSYNASKASTLAFLEMVDKLEVKPVVFVFGDMRELGGQAKKEHQAVADRLMQVIDYLYCVGPLTKKYVVPYVKMKNEKGKVKEVKSFANFFEAGQYLKKNLPKGSLVLIKGSQNEIFLEEVVKAVLKNKKDVSQLCRQERFWLKKKKLLLNS